MPLSLSSATPCSAASRSARGPCRVGVPAVAPGHNVAGDGRCELLAVGDPARLGPADVAVGVEGVQAQLVGDLRPARPWGPGPNGAPGLGAPSTLGTATRRVMSRRMLSRFFSTKASMDAQRGSFTFIRNLIFIQYSTLAKFKGKLRRGHVGVGVSDAPHYRHHALPGPSVPPSSLDRPSGNGAERAHGDAHEKHRPSAAMR